MKSGFLSSKEKAKLLLLQDWIYSHWGTLVTISDFRDSLNLNGKMVLEFIHLCGAVLLSLLLMEEVKMAKKKTLKRPKKSGTKFLKEHVPFQSKLLKDSEAVTEALLDCIRTGDIDSFRELLAAHLVTANKTELAKKAQIGRRTIYDIIDPNKEFNPELTTISSLIRAL